MKELTRALLMFAFGLMFAAFITVEQNLGIIATGIFVFCYIYDPRFRKAF